VGVRQQRQVEHAHKGLLLASGPTLPKKGSSAGSVGGWSVGDKFLEPWVEPDAPYKQNGENGAATFSPPPGDHGVKNFPAAISHQRLKNVRSECGMGRRARY